MKRKKLTARLSILSAIALLSIQPASAMHIMEGYMPLDWCAIWYALSLPFVVLSFMYLRRQVKRSPRIRISLGLAGAFVFVLSALKLPSVTGSSSHLTGTTLGTVTVGPMAMPLLGLIVLLFQALLLAHGGISTLGANVFSMAVAGPFVAYAVYILLGKIGFNKQEKLRHIKLFIATFLGTMATYITTSFQLAIVYPDAQSGIWGAAMKFLSLFAVTQVPLAILEGIITALVFSILLKQGVKPVYMMIADNNK